MLKKQLNRKKRHHRIRGKISGIGERPRICVFRSNKHLYVQLIDDVQGKTLVSVSDSGIKSKKGLTKVQLAEKIGQKMGEKAKELGIEKAVFDKGGYKYHGQVSAIAKGAREAGLAF